MHITPRIGLALTTLAALGLAAAHPASAAPAAPSSLSGQSRLVNSSITVNLTAEGTVDWTDYSQAADGSPITYRKAGVPPASGITLTGVSGPQAYSNVGNNAPTFTWTNGAAPNQTGSSGAEYYYGTNGGVTTGSYTLQSVSMPGTTSLFNLYTGAYSGGATILANLYDANGVVIQTFSDSFAAAPNNNVYKEYSFAYTGGAYLSTTVTSTNPYGNGFHTVNLQAASLATPEPSSLAAFAVTGLGIAGSALAARKRRLSA